MPLELFKLEFLISSEQFTYSLERKEIQVAIMKIN